MLELLHQPANCHAGSDDTAKGQHRLPTPATCTGVNPARSSHDEKQAPLLKNVDALQRRHDDDDKDDDEDDEDEEEDEDVDWTQVRHCAPA